MTPLPAHPPVLLPLLAEAHTEVGGWRWTSLPPGWVLTLVAIGLFLIFRALYQGERGRAGRPTRVALALVRALVLFLIVLALADPYREVVTIAEERAHLVVLVDASGSMETEDRYDEDEAARLRAAVWPDGRGAPPAGAALETSRLALLQGVLAPEGDALLRALDRRFVLHAFGFASDWWSLGATRDEAPTPETADSGDPVRAIGEAVRALEPGGDRDQGGTNLGTVLRNVAGEYLGREDRRLAGVLLLTDGRDTGTDENPLDVVAALGNARTDLHVTPVALGNASSGRNVRVERIRALDVVLVGDDVVFETALRHQGFTGLPGVEAALEIVQVADERGEAIDESPYEPGGNAIRRVGPLTLPQEDEPLPVRLQARLNEPGTFLVRIRAVLPPDAAQDDAIREDDVAEHEIRVVDQRIKVLYADNLPRREFHFLGNWLTREPVYDPARPEERRRYDAQLFQQSADPTVDQRSSLGVEPLHKFPTTRSELFAYDVILLGDVDWKRFGASIGEARDVLALIRDFVKEGGGLALIAGEDCRNPLDFVDTPLQDLLPVNPRPTDTNRSDLKDERFRLELSEIGRQHPIFGIVPGRQAGGIASPEEVADAWAGRRDFSTEWTWYWLYRATGGLRPGAMALATARPDPGPVGREFLDENGRPLVALATLPYGKGRVFFSALDGLWRLRYGQADRFYGPFWDQVIRYLATYRLLGGNKRYKITTDKDTYFVGDTATITITALDENFDPRTDVFLDGVHVEDPRGEDRLLDGDDRPRNATVEGAAPGTYRCLLPVRREGTWRIWIDEGERTFESRAEKRFDAEDEVPERRQTMPDHDVLVEIARATDGRLLDGAPAHIEDLPALASELPARATRRVLKREERSQWDRAWTLLLLAGLLGLEWALRKRAQMI